MSYETIHPKTMRAWLTVAMFAPLAHYSGGAWPVLVVLSLLAVGLMGLLPENTGVIRNSKILCVLELGWILVLAGHYLSLSAVYWPGEKSELAVPAALLLLGAYSCKGRPARTAGVLYWVLILMLVPFALAAVRDAKVEWIIPKELKCSAWIVPVLLLPALGTWLTVPEKQCNTGWVSWFFGIGLWCATSAVLSPKVASDLEAPFRDLSRSLTLGAGSRFESLASVMITLGWFALASLFLKLATELIKNLGVKENIAPWVCAVPPIALSWLKVQQNPLFSAFMTLVLWILVPMLYCKKISKKSEKSA